MKKTTFYGEKKRRTVENPEISGFCVSKVKAVLRPQTINERRRSERVVVLTIGQI